MSSAALAIYVVMERDPVDALELINECTDRETLELLLKMLTHVGTERTDTKLNAIFVGPVERRLECI